VLILASSPRQCDHWQRAVELAALRVRLDPLAGALACLPAPDPAPMNPWLLTWRTLATAVACQLHDLLKPLPPAACAGMLRLEEGEDEVHHVRAPAKASVAAAAAGTPARLGHLIVGKLAQRVAHLTQDDLEEQEVIALLGLRLTPRQWSILRLLLAHPLLSDEELAALLGLQQRSVRCVLYELHQLGCLEPLTTRVGKRWHLYERGLRLLAAANHIPIRTIAVISDEAAYRETSAMAQPGEAWLVQHVEHTAGVYGFFARLGQAARREAGQALCWWETGALCERRYRVGEQWYNLRPDALAAYRIGREQMRFWLEWDRGTMNVRDLQLKFASYAHYISSREWARDSSRLPGLLCVAPDIAQERRVQRVAQATLTATPGIGVLDDHRGAVERVWATGPHLVARSPPAQSSSTAGRFAETGTV
jgi:DNA-binding MarR family transcriptional regulator